MDRSQASLQPSMIDRTPRIIGVLFLTAMVSSISGGLLVESALSTTQYLTGPIVDRIPLLTGILLELVNAIAVVGIAVLFYPILKIIGREMALGYLAFRIIEAVLCSLIIIYPLAIDTLGQGSLRSTVSETQFHALRLLSIAERGVVQALLVPVFFCLGASLLYYLLYKSECIPRFISVWGMIGVISVFGMNMLTLFQVSLSTGVMVALVAPIILNEVFMGLWLIIKGLYPQVSTRTRQAERVH